MRLISCYIENFGGLTKFSYDFTDGLNTILEENGWGKSTLAGFLKAMFYGLERTTKRSLYENERKKYEPWNGGAYGGNLVFETRGNQYRIERFFGIKDKEDSFILYDVRTGLQSPAYTERIGEELFGIDRLSFEQSIFMRQGVYEISMTDSIAAKMSGLMANGDDLDCYEKACNRLEAEMKIYKKIGNKGRISELAEEISLLNRKISDAGQIRTAIEEWRNREAACRHTLNTCYLRKEELKSQIRKAGEQVGQREKSRYYDTLLAEKEKLGRNIEELDLYFRNGVPGEEELEEYRHKLYICKRKEDIPVLEQSRFHYPDMAELLSANPMTEEELEACEQKWNLIQEKEKLLERKEMQIQTLEIGEEKRAEYLQDKQDALTVRQRVFLVLAVLIMFAAIVLYITADERYAWIGGGVAVALALVAVICTVQKKKLADTMDEENEELLQLQEEKDDMAKNIDNMKKAVRMYLHTFFVTNKEDIPACINRLRITIMECKAQEERRIQQKEQQEKSLKTKEAVRDELILFLGRFYQEVSEVEEHLFKEIEQKRNEYLSIAKQYEAKCRQLAETDQIEKIPEEELLSMEELQGEESILERNITEQEDYLRQIKQTIAQYTETLEACEKWEMEKQDLEELLSEYTAKYKLLEKTLKYLKTAQNEFSSRYLRKMNEGFAKYTKLFREDAFKQSALDVKLTVKSDENGVKRDIGYYSTGFQETMELCTRLALIEALFEKEQPFIVLDDPFVNLDEKSMEGAKKVLLQLANQYQLIYFTCHSSRQ